MHHSLSWLDDSLSKQLDEGLQYQTCMITQMLIKLLRQAFSKHLSSQLDVYVMGA